MLETVASHLNSSKLSRLVFATDYIAISNIAMISLSLVIHKGCEDHSSSCKNWAKRGHCKEKPIFMFAFCRWTCKQCAKESGKRLNA